MSTTITVATPHYLLLDSDGPIGPAIMQSTSDVESFVVYGFSSRPRYDRFCAARHTALRPYPLLKGHLIKPSNFTGKRITLIAIDPDGPEGFDVRATSAESLVHSLQAGSDQVPVEFHLIASDQGSTYQIQTEPRYFRQAPGETERHSQSNESDKESP